MIGGPVLRGVVGHVKWHFYTAAAINGYALTKKSGGLSLVATVVMRDAFKLAQRPLIFEAPYKKGTPPHVTQGVWQWPIVAYTLSESGRLTATLGPEIIHAIEVEPPKDLCLDFSNPK